MTQIRYHATTRSNHGFEAKTRKLKFVTVIIKYYNGELYWSHIVIVLSMFLIVFLSSLQLLWRDQETRTYLVRDIRQHPFFEMIDWPEVENGKSPPAFAPKPVSI